MTIKPLLFSLSLLGIFSATSAQDRIYKRNGMVEAVHIKFIEGKQISYYGAGKSDSAEHTLSTNAVSKIVYEDGHVTIYEEPVLAREGRPRSKRYGNNIVCLTPLSITHNGVGIYGVSYERLFGKKGKFGLILPVNTTFIGINLGEDERGRSGIQLTPGIKFYPWGSRIRMNCALGLQFLYEEGSTMTESHVAHANKVPVDFKRKEIISNLSFNLFSSPNFHVGLDGGVGYTFENKKEKILSKNIMEPAAQLMLVNISFRIGWRW